jgi:transposase-like protein
MKAVNPGMHFEYLPNEGETRNGREVFGRAFWAFGQSIKAFKWCRLVVTIDGTFLTSKFEGTLLICIGTDAEDQLVPLAFAIVQKEDTSSWSWFLKLVRQVVIGLERDVCVISNRHAGILNAVQDELPGYD